MSKSMDTSRGVANQCGYTTNLTGGRGTSETRSENFRTWHQLDNRYGQARTSLVRKHCHDIQTVHCTVSANNGTHYRHRWHRGMAEAFRTETTCVHQITSVWYSSHGNKLTLVYLIPMDYELVRHFVSFSVCKYFVSYPGCAVSITWDYAGQATEYVGAK